MAIYIEDFSGAAADLAAPWQQYASGNPFRRNGSGLGAPTSTGADSGAIYNGTFNKDQYSQIVPQFNGPGDGSKYIYLFLRASGSAGSYGASGTFYWFWSDGGSDTKLLWTTTGGVSPTTLDSANAFTFSAGDTLKFEVIGTTLKVYKNGTPITWTTSGTTSVTDSNIASGLPGVGGEGSTLITVDTWQGGDLVPTFLQPPANPVTLRLGYENRTHLDPIHRNLIGKDKFFDAPGQGPTYDWPNPRGYAYPNANRTYVDGANIWLIGKDTFFRGPGQAPTYDYPNPLIKPLPIEDRSFTHTNTTLGIPQPTQAPFYCTDWPNPYPPKRGLQPTHLRPAGQPGPAPFTPTEWPNPRVAGQPFENKTEADGTEFWLLAPNNQPPLRPAEFPNPRIARNPVTNLTSTFYYVIDDSRPFVTTEWPNPQRPIYSFDARGQISYLVVDDNVPFLGNGANPNPRIAGQPLENKTQADASEFWLFTPANPPVRPIDWPNPFTRIGTYENRTEADGTEFWLLAPNTQAPFTPIDFPNPGIKAWAIENRSEIDPSEFFGLLKDQFFGAPGQPPANRDWPNPLPKISTYENRTIAGGTEYWLLAPNTQAPFVPIDFPNPGIKAWAIENRTEIDPSEFFGLLKDQFFGAPGQPPSPTPSPSLRIALYPYELRTWTQGHLLDTLAPLAAAPFTQTEWPNPGLKGFALENRTEMDGSEFWMLRDQFFGIPGQPPTYLANPNPLIARQPIDLRTWLQNLVTTTLAPGLPPPNYTDWPNPRGYAYPISARTLAEFTRLLGKDKIFGVAGQPISNFQQPNPLGYVYPMELRSGFARQTLTTALPEMTPAYIIHVDADAWIIAVPADPLLGVD